MSDALLFKFLHVTQLRQIVREVSQAHVTPTDLYLHPSTARYYFGEMVPVYILGMRVHLESEIELGKVVVTDHPVTS